jgi:hypothetical protein
VFSSRQGKGKVVPVLNTMKTYGGVEVYTYGFLISALAGGEWSVSLPARFTPGERAPGTNCIGDLVGPRVNLYDMEK